MSLTLWMYGWGGVLMAGGIGAFVAPERAADGLRRFPRSRAAAGVLSALALGWTAWMVRETATGRLSFLQTGAFPLAVVLWFLIYRYMDELLAPRALGGLLLLAAEPWLFSVRMHPSPWSRVPAGLAYLLVLAGLALLLSPYLFRRALAPTLVSPNRLRGSAAGWAGFGLLLILFARAALA